MASSSGLNQELGLLLAREQDLNLLPSRVDLVVALILVVLQRRVVPDPIAERAHAIHRPERVEQRLRTAGQRALPRLEAVDRRIEFAIARLTTRPSSGRWRLRSHVYARGMASRRECAVGEVSAGLSARLRRGGRS